MKSSSVVRLKMPRAWSSWESSCFHRTSRNRERSDATTKPERFLLHRVPFWIWLFHSFPWTLFYLETIFAGLQTVLCRFLVQENNANFFKNFSFQDGQLLQRRWLSLTRNRTNFWKCGHLSKVHRHWKICLEHCSARRMDRLSPENLK